jgi:hypothetical protein
MFNKHMDFLNIRFYATDVSLMAEKEQLVDNVIRLRRAERVSPTIEDLALVRADLERLIGHTVPRAMAARRLDISQTALDRWVARGDIPAVMTPRGRREVPLGALLDLVDDVERHRQKNPDDRHPLGSVLHARRKQAERLKPEAVLPARYRRPEVRHGHRRAELQGLAYHRVVARRLDSRLVVEARSRLSRWEHEGRIDPRYATDWRQVLSWPIPRIKRLISQDSQRARDLRQNSPFAGVLHERERQRVLEAVG